MRKISVIIAFLLCAYTLCAQDDFMQPSLNAFFKSKPGSAQQVAAANQFFHALKENDFLDESVHYDTNTHADTLRAQVAYWAASVYYEKEQYKHSDSLATLALPLIHNGADRQLEADCLGLLAAIHLRLGDFDNAIEYAKNCNVLDMQAGRPNEIASSLNSIASIYLAAGMPEEAEGYALKAINYCQKADNPQRLSIIYGITSEIYQRMKKPEPALEYATKGRKLEQQLNRPERVAVRKVQQASALQALNRTNEARTLLEEAIPVLREYKLLHSLGIACNQLGLLCHRENDDSTAVRLFNEALTIFTEQHDLYNELHTRQGLYQCLRNSQPELAFLHIDRYNLLRDSVYDHTTGLLLTKYAAEFDYDSLLKQNNALHRRYQLLLFGGIALLLVLLILTIFFRVRFFKKIRALTRDIELLREEQDAAPMDNGATAQATGDQTLAQDNLSKAEHAFLQQLLAEVDKGLLTGEVDSETLASRMNMSKSTFRRRLQAITQSTPKAFVAAIQMQRATQLLTDGSGLSVQEIALRCGFKEASTFSRAFMRTFGVSPSRYAANRAKANKQAKA